MHTHIYADIHIQTCAQSICVVQDMSAFKIAALQKALEESVPQADLDKVNKEYHQLTEKYRDLLEKGNTLVSKAEAITSLEVCGVYVYKCM